MLTVDELKKRTAADWVAGKLVGMADGKHVELAVMAGTGEVTLTLDGHQLAETLDPLDHDAKGGKGGSRPRGKKAAEAEPTPPVVPEGADVAQGTVDVVEGAADTVAGEAGADLNLDLFDNASTQDAVG